MVLGRNVEVALVTLSERQLWVLTTFSDSHPHDGWTLPAEYATGASDDQEIAAGLLTKRFEITVPKLHMIGLQSSRSNRGIQIESIGPFLTYCAFAPYSKVQQITLKTQMTRIERMEYLNQTFYVDFGYYNQITRIIEDALSSVLSLKFKAKNDHIIDFFSLLEDEFTLSDLQFAVEAITHVDVDKRNFRRDMMSSGLIEETGTVRRGRNRPANLFRLKPHQRYIKSNRK